MDPQILNDGLELAMVFGPDWLKPIQPRLALKYPELTPAELEACNTVCREAMFFGHNLLLVVWKKAHHDEPLTRAFFARGLLAKYPWVSPENLAHLTSQSYYYAFK